MVLDPSALAKALLSMGEGMKKGHLFGYLADVTPITFFTTFPPARHSSFFNFFFFSPTYSILCGNMAE